MVGRFDVGAPEMWCSELARRAVRRSGQPGKARCRFHGGLSTGPRTIEGRAELLRLSGKDGQKWPRDAKVSG